MRLLLCGGGTEGHITPSLGLAEEMEKEGDSILFVTRRHADENKKIIKASYPYFPIDIKSLSSFPWYEKHKYLLSLKHAVQQSRRILQDFSPDAVFATGGYVSLPPVLAAREYGIPIFLHESNAVAGRATTAMLRHARALFLGMPESEKNFKGAREIHYVGTPVRRAFFEGSRALSRRRLGLGEGFMILSFGGSLGAEVLNEACLSLMENYSRRNGIIHIHITGRRYYDTLDKLHHFSSFPDRKCKAVSFLDNIEEYMRACDIVICRSGAATISEVMASGVYPIFIPSPNVKNNHQFLNAKAISTISGVPILKEGKTLLEELQREVDYAYSHPVERRKKAALLHSFSTPSSAKNILNFIKKCLSDM